MSGAHLARRVDFRYLIVGGGMACDAAARGIRQVDANGSIGIIADEEDPPVARPALTKKLWTDPEFTFDSSLPTVEHWSDDDAGVVYYLAGERVAGVLLWNVPGQLDAARATIAQGAAIRLDDLAGRIPLTDDRRSAA